MVSWTINGNITADDQTVSNLIPADLKKTGQITLTSAGSKLTAVAGSGSKIVFSIKNNWTEPWKYGSNMVILKLLLPSRANKAEPITFRIADSATKNKFFEYFRNGKSSTVKTVSAKTQNHALVTRARDNKKSKTKKKRPAAHPAPKKFFGLF